MRATAEHSPPHRRLGGGAPTAPLLPGGDPDPFGGDAPVALGRWPTPIEPVETLGGASVLVKRDDLSGFGRGGTKARKLESLIGHLLAVGADPLITVAGNVTNLAFDLLPALDAHRIEAVLLIIDDPPVRHRDREEIFEGIRGRVRLVSGSRIEAAAAALGAYRRAARAGRRPFLLLPGVSHPSGVIGNARGFLEMAAQLDAAGAPLPGVVYVTAATGTTLAGFLIGAAAVRRLFGATIRVVGVQVYPGAIARQTLALIRWTERALRLPWRVDTRAIEIDRTSLAGGFGRFTVDLAGTCERLADATGLWLDPIFGGKTWAAMERRLQCDTDAGAGAGGPPLYWHCGFTPEWRLLGRAAHAARGRP